MSINRNTLAPSDPSKHDHVLAEEQSPTSSRDVAHKETSTDFDTVILDVAKVRDESMDDSNTRPKLKANSSKKASPESKTQSRTSAKTKRQTTAQPQSDVRRSALAETKTKSKHPKRLRRKTAKKRPEKSPFFIKTENEQAEETEQEIDWEQTYRGMPSWLTSMIIHLSIILTLALLTVNRGGKQVIDLFASTTEAIEIKPFESFDLTLPTEEIETVSQELESEQSEIVEASELAPVLEEALSSASLESQLTDNMFEQISTSGLAESDMPNVNDGKAQFFGINGEGSDFVFIIDCSDSMNHYGRWNQAVDELKRSINKLTPKQRFLILLYNSGYIAMNNQTKLVKSTTQQRKRAIRWLVNNTPMNWTFCADALEDALKLRPSAIFLLSDGEFSDRAEVFEVLDEFNSKRDAKYSETPQIPVHTVALGSHIGRFTMERIAEENGGIFKLIE